MITTICDFVIKNAGAFISISTTLVILYFWWRNEIVFRQGFRFTTSINPIENKISIEECNPHNNDVLISSIYISPYRYNHYKQLTDKDHLEYECKMERLGKNGLYFMNNNFLIKANSIETFETKASSKPEDDFLKRWGEEFKNNEYFYITILFANGRKQTQLIKNGRYNGYQDKEWVVNGLKYYFYKVCNFPIIIKNWALAKLFKLIKKTIMYLTIFKVF